ncbi:hypothetical protein ACFL6C_04580 [Myxococcota bacterium]
MSIESLRAVPGNKEAPSADGAQAEVKQTVKQTRLKHTRLKSTRLKRREVDNQPGTLEQGVAKEGSSKPNLVKQNSSVQLASKDEAVRSGQERQRFPPPSHPLLGALDPVSSECRDEVAGSLAKIHLRSLAKTPAKKKPPHVSAGERASSEEERAEADRVTQHNEKKQRFGAVAQVTNGDGALIENLENPFRTT